MVGVGVRVGVTVMITVGMGESGGVVREQPVGDPVVMVVMQQVERRVCRTVHRCDQRRGAEQRGRAPDIPDGKVRADRGDGFRAESMEPVPGGRLARPRPGEGHLDLEIFRELAGETDPSHQFRVRERVHGGGEDEDGVALPGFPEMAAELSDRPGRIDQRRAEDDLRPGPLRPLQRLRGMGHRGEIAAGPGGNHDQRNILRRRLGDQRCQVTRAGDDGNAGQGGERCGGRGLRSGVEDGEMSGVHCRSLPDRIVDADQFRPVRERRLHLDETEDVPDTVLDLVGTEDSRPDLHRLGDRVTVSGRLDDRFADQGGRLRDVEPQTTGAAAPGDFSGSEEQKLLLLAGSEIHGVLPVGTDTTVTADEARVSSPSTCFTTPKQSGTAGTTMSLMRRVSVLVLLDQFFFVFAGVAAVWLAWLLFTETFDLGWWGILILVLFWLMLAYLTLPRLHRILTRIYVPDYFIGRTRTSDGLLGDPVNIAVLGDEDQLRRTMADAGWTPAEPVTLSSSWRIVTSVLRRRSYLSAPVSPLYLFGRQQDIAYQQQVAGNPSKRHHVRFWRTPDGWLLPGGARVDWLAAATFDRAVGFSLFTLQITHRIDADIDVERDHVISTVLDGAGCGVPLTVITGFSSGYHTRNGGGDTIHTDGDLPILDLRGIPRAA